VNTDQLLPLKVAALLTGLDYQRLWRLVKAGDIPATDLGNERSAWYVRLSDVNAWIERRSA
jgi:predicted DNA-binding transcriptional regulator AlpA